MIFERPWSGLGIGCLLAAMLLSGCGRETGPTTRTKATSPVSQPAAATAEAPPPELPAAATAGDVLPPLPKAARRLSAGPDAAPLLPSMPCNALAPDREYKLGQKFEVMRSPTSAAASSGTLELCLFHRWLTRPADELARRTGRVHHFVAAFPGDEVAAWTSDDMERAAANTRPEWALAKAAGWSRLIPTGIPDRPAIAVVSARFYDGPLGEELHWRRQARVLTRHKDRWTWRPLASRDFASLDTAQLVAVCGAAEAEADKACLGADEQVEAARRAAHQRGEQRQARFDSRGDRSDKRRRGKKSASVGAKPAEYIGDGDPQSAWLRDGRRALARGDWRSALTHAMYIDMVCGEAVQEAHELLRDALAKGGLKREKALPQLRPVGLCQPLFDKPGPKRDK